MDLSWSELLVVGIVALIFIGPKDLPGMFRELGRFMAKVRSMGREFSRAMEQAAKESGVKDVADDLKKISNPKAMGLDAVRNAADKFEKWDPMKPAAGVAKATAPLTPPPMPPMPIAAPIVAAPGSATAELAEKVTAKKAASAEKTAQLREAKTAAKAAAPKAASPKAAVTVAPQPPAVVAEPPAVKHGGRVRKKAEPGDAA
ncbi:MAG: twin-arginine translocase subunit TatB [Rhodobacteraceae bacterium]|nr:twin-arginine translocase subunit TatB [Paracoccaceae bacterium]